MNTTTTTMESVKTFFSGFRKPDPSKLWRGGSDTNDETDSSKKEAETPLALKLESALIRFQELALWTEPKATGMALALVQLCYLYLQWTSCTSLNLIMWTILIAFVYTTWVNR